ncbi:universal stress protein [Roseibium album]|uniref:universal stress protein n=1 Tax=Roseibium album TaxID=311410 RepID=UPI000CF1BA41|nr:nucleotide-binding universal stress UspA family protein [Labrenzia sp. EL_142]
MATVKIIAAVDLHHREADACVVREAIMLAQSHEAAVELVFVIPDQQNTYVQAYIPEDMRNQVEVDARKDLEAYAGEFDWNGVSCTTEVLRGVVYEKLIEHADERSARFIVIGASRPTVKDLFIGPNAARVSRFASCCVLVVRPE